MNVTGPLLVAQVNEVIIRFNSKITTNTRTSVSSDNASSGVWSHGASHGNQHWWGWQNSYSAWGSYSNQATSSRNVQEKRDFSLAISVLAVQDDLPGGMKKILSLLEQGFLTGQK